MKKEFERLSLRLPKNTKEILQNAANTMGLSLTDFVVNAAISRAYEIIRLHQLVLEHNKESHYVISLGKNDD